MKLFSIAIDKTIKVLKMIQKIIDGIEMATSAIDKGISLLILILENWKGKK